LVREEDAKKNTQARVAKLLGVDRTTVTKWFTPDAARSNVNGHNASKPQPDARVKVNPKAKPAIAERVALLDLLEPLGGPVGNRLRRFHARPFHPDHGRGVGSGFSGVFGDRFPWF
jgi:hypothetical protein